MSSLRSLAALAIVSASVGAAAVGIESVERVGSQWQGSAPWLLVVTRLASDSNRVAVDGKVDAAGQFAGEKQTPLSRVGFLIGPDGITPTNVSPCIELPSWRGVFPPNGEQRRLELSAGGVHITRNGCR